jgi:hypothetical protein
LHTGESRRLQIANAGQIIFPREIESARESPALRMVLHFQTDGTRLAK